MTAKTEVATKGAQQLQPNCDWRVDKLNKYVKFPQTARDNLPRMSPHAKVATKGAWQPQPNCDQPIKTISKIRGEPRKSAATYPK